MGWSDYGFNGLDVTFAPINRTFLAVAMALNERLVFLGESNTTLERWISGYYNINFPPWKHTQGMSASNNLNIVAYLLRLYCSRFVYSRNFPRTYIIDVLGEEACNAVAQTGRTCVYDAREFSSNQSLIRDFYKEKILSILDQTWILKYKKMLDLMRYAWVSVSGSSSCYSVRYDNHNGAMDSTPAGAIASAEASQVESVISIGSSWITGSLLYAFKNISDNTYRINYILKSLYVLKANVDAAIASASDPTAPFFVFVGLRCRLVGTSTTEYYNYNFCAAIDTSAVFPISGWGDCYKITVDSTTSNLEQLFEELIDTIQATTTANIYVDARVSGIVQIFDGINTFQFLNT